MDIKTLGNIDFDEFLDCFLVAFENYFVKMPTDKNYYKARWEAASVDFNLSYGLFDNERLIGFIIHAIDQRNGVVTAFNTGTGVIPEYRGKGIVKSIYEFAIKDLEQKGIEKSTLEVITKNEIAIRTYKSIGFEIYKKYRCFNGTINLENYGAVDLEEIEFNKLDWENLPNQKFYSWDNQKESIQKGNYRFFRILKEKIIESFFVINPDTGYLAQFDLMSNSNEGWNRLFAGISQISDTIKINNIDEQLTKKIEYVNSIGLVNTVDQYEMKLNIKGGSTA